MRGPGGYCGRVSWGGGNLTIGIYRQIGGSILTSWAARARSFPHSLEPIAGPSAMVREREYSNLRLEFHEDDRVRKSPESKASYW